MSIRVLRASDHRRMPWKNGRGETVEIAVFPEAAGLDDFQWRVSMAGVTEDGEFSIFPGIDRTLAVLSGEGIELHVAGRGPQRLTRDYDPLAFPADAPTAARLVQGPITDLNVMTRRGQYSHRLARDAGPCDLRLILATAPLTLSLAGQVHALGPLDVLYCDGPEAALPPGPVTNAWLIEISRAT
ncbi:HutD family protein [Paracoccus litorisediminis]|uniref:HutD/Ves family protein n=1 Tax=Paracoccus litorisediminis TaxID=2006130 RepID=UPI0012B6E91E|nr:HutD family protein [Paracoccus litorisediminis]